MADNPFDAVSYLAYSVFLFLYWGDACLFILMLIVLFGNGIRRRFMRSLSWYGGEKHKIAKGVKAQTISRTKRGVEEEEKTYHCECKCS
ncbi:uncharacterized protein LOC116249571 isoform X7 [Nymphaea colorata]|uniref:uncharacterized protein LOC116249571 isoform X7 n=1 Tax=Nymphaea colorata TaxID=210225 RepID=UPI00129D5BE0|nr:uncharacterized protein LOC116249571 isoform X7 [Nymphaea colorata]